MKTPGFWRSRSLFSTLLLPAALLYHLSVWIRQVRAQFPESLAVPVICIGNLIAGGAGKTPVALAVGRRLKEKNIRVYFLSRGYGGSLKGPLLVNPHIHSAYEVGDEPLLLAKTLPTIIAKNRRQGAKFAIEQGAEAIVMDDGFQNLTLKKTLSILVINGDVLFGNGRLIPAGPLREPVQDGFKRADAVIVIDQRTPIPEIPGDLPVMSATIGPTPLKDIKDKKVVAFAGIAYPERFFNTVESLGAKIEAAVPFSDHYIYNDGDMERLVALAKKEGAMLVTTAKDAVRLTPAWRPLVTVVDIDLKLQDPEALDDLLAGAMQRTW